MSDQPLIEDRIGLTNLPVFEYTALPSGSVRVINPATTNESSVLSWNMETIKLDDSDLGYEALSYVWGPQNLTYPIQCNGAVLQVHYNLYSAFPYLARRGDHRPVRPLWIDAICINQKDEQEPRTQIKMMGKLYQGAVKVWVWLGLAKHQERVPEAIDLFPRIIAANAYEKEHQISRGYRHDDVLEIFDPGKLDDAP